MMASGVLSLCGLYLLLVILPSSIAREESKGNDESSKPPVVDWHAYEHANAEGFNKALETSTYNLVAFILPKNFESQKIEWGWPAVKEQEPNVLSVNCAAESSLCLEHDVRSYPAVRLYRSGQLYARHRGSRNAEDILAFARRTAGPMVSGLDATNITSFPASDHVTLILHLRPEDADQVPYRRFHDLAREFYDRWSFAIVGRDQDKSVDEEGEDAPTVLRCYNNLDGLQMRFDEFWGDVDSLRSFVEGCGRRVVEELGKLNMHEFLDGPRSALLYFDADPAARAGFARNMLPLAKASVDALDFVTVDPLAYSDVVHRVNLPWEFPAMALRNPLTRTIQLFNKGYIDEDLVARFIAGALGGGGPGRPGPFGEAQVDDDEGVAEDGESQSDSEEKGRETRDEL